MLKQPLGLFRIALLWVGVLSAQESRAQDHTRWGLPEGEVDLVSFSPDGQTLASGGAWTNQTIAKKERASCESGICF